MKHLKHNKKKSNRNKFNGFLVMKWAELRQGPYLADILNEFKIHIKNTFSTSFNEYLDCSMPFKVKSDFFKYYYELDYRFELKTDIPF